ncbi:MAG TPA: ATP-dependent protease ATPase subunit HslU [Thermoanaerobaculia bacterium]|nr:ATP-dependent protease ATPase subunit HslU [Thermoanaerobaculia bacterium]
MTTQLPEPTAFVEDLTPRQIVAALDDHVVGQAKAKRAVAIAMRNRWRRQQLPPDIAEDIVPKNILMIGPTGVGKTEIARRLAKLARAPFLKIEASKFTEVGYVGRDVESMVRDLVELAISMVREERRGAVMEEASRRAEERLLKLLVPPPRRPQPSAPAVHGTPQGPQPAGFASDEPADSLEQTREKFRARLRRGALDDRMVEIEVEESSFPQLEMFGPQGVEEVGINLKEMMPGMFSRRKARQMTVAEARQVLEQQESEAMIDRQQVAREALRRVEQGGILFLDEIDKICGREGQQGPDVSREGVQRDLLPIVEGTTVTTKHGMVKTDHVLFIGAGAFHVSKPSDMIPELQGRFPIRVELEALREEDFVRILTEPQSSLTKQYRALLGTEGLEIAFTDDAVTELARLAVEVNAATENIGARRLATLMERLLEDVSFEAPDMDGVSLTLDGEAVRSRLAGIVEDRDLSRYVL